MLQDSDLMELEKNVELSWLKLVEPFDKMMDQLVVVWGAINHLKSVKDTPELRSSIEEIQPEKVEFDLKLGQSKPIYNAYKAIRESPDWATLRRNLSSGFHDFFLELTKLTRKFEENVLDATKKFEKLITDKKETEGLPATSLGLVAQTV
ncbi:hypothetical protein L6452_05623 [Arctium lappa]|uniref:Uncharacterized protein n=1 Tax=Arctium lappa TaxID=4217 RepID=A0ACB9EHD5_ARCLA|nr:hypothetical protein L6452_05623 [Arctium lappa]